MEICLKKSLDHERVNYSSEEAREKWKKLREVVHNSKRWFRFVIDLSKLQDSDAAMQDSSAGENDHSGVASPETVYFSCEDDQPNNDDQDHCKTYTSKQKVLEWIFVSANFILELLSVVFDQLSSQHYSHSLIICVVMSFLILLICILDFAYKVRKERVVWSCKGKMPWFYYPSPSPNGVPFGSFTDIIGLVCAFGQCILITISYYLFLKNGNNPINISIWPTIFAFGQLSIKFWQKYFKENVCNQNASSTELTSVP